MSNTMVKVMAPGLLYADMAITDDNGHWSIGDVIFPDSTKFIVQATNAKGHNQWNLSFDADAFPTVNPLLFNKSIYKSTKLDDDLEVSYISNEKQRLQYINGVSCILLDEVMVTKKRPDNRVRRSQTFNYKYLDYMEIRSYEGIIPKFAGVSFQGGVPMYGGKPVAFIVDGRGISGYDDSNLGNFSFLPPVISKGKNYDVLYMINQRDKRHIVSAYEVLNQVCPFNFVGDISFSGGVISIRTKDAKEYKDPDYTIKTIRPLGYQRPAEFYSPRYDAGDNGIGEGTDLRETLYWNPSVTINNDKQARFDFFANDVSNTSYTITIEGVTPSGEIVHSVKQIFKK